jgi:hypothetical protein
MTSARAKDAWNRIALALNCPDVNVLETVALILKEARDAAFKEGARLCYEVADKKPGVGDDTTIAFSLGYGSGANQCGNVLMKMYDPSYGSVKEEEPRR